MLGDNLLSKQGLVKTEQALAGKTAVALYFSAHWCPPCRGFTPSLCDAYKNLAAAGKALEIIFVSSDRDEKAFDEYFAEMPFLALPYSERGVKASISKKFKVSGIPTLVILDGENGSIITTDGRSSIAEDPMGENFPWRPPTLWEALGTEFLSGMSGDTIEVDELRGPGKVIGVYFSAHWCPPCRSFTPELVSAYKKLKSAGKDVEIIFASSDRDSASFAEYYGSMPWLAIPQGDKRKEMLSKLFEVEGIPTLVFIDGETGETITTNGRAAVGGDPEGAEFPWHPKPVTDLALGSEGLNDETCLCAMLEGCSAEVQAAAMEVLAEVAVASKAAGEDVLFFAATKLDKGPVGQIRKLTALGEPSTTPQLVLLDIPDDGGYYTREVAKVTADAVKTFLEGYKAKTMERKQLG